MATQFGNNGQSRDRANGVTVGGKSVIPKVSKKTGRKPLGEISNSNALKPPQHHVAQKQQNSVGFSYFGNEKGAHKSTIPLNPKKSSEAAKKALPAARKPLGDISNSRKAALPHVSQKTKVKSGNVLELGDPGSDKGFLHNHAECIKTQKLAVDMDYFLETVGHCKGNGVSSLNMMQPLHSLSEEDMDLNIQMPELLSEEGSPMSSKAESQLKHKWSPPCKSPRSPSLYMQWGNGDTLDCCLAETPTILEY